MIKRILKHLFTTRRDGRQAFPEFTLEAIQAAITEGELQHRAEVRVIIEAALPLAELAAGRNARQRAGDLFSAYGIWDTEENIGLLVYINLADHKVEIITDRALGRMISVAEWQAICNTMTESFHRGEYHAGTIAALGQISRLLHAHFPAQGTDVNELPNRPLIV